MFVLPTQILKSVVMSQSQKYKQIFMHVVKGWWGKYFQLQVVAFWLVMSQSDVVGYQHLGGPCFLPLQGECMFYFLNVLHAFLFFFIIQ
jgi:hypothetical protein